MDDDQEGMLNNESPKVSLTMNKPYYPTRCNGSLWLRFFNIIVFASICIFISGCCTSAHFQNAEDIRWIRHELYFGLTRPGGVPITEMEWIDFLNKSVTPRFPDGLTIIQGDGRYRNNTGTLTEEPSRMIVVLSPFVKYLEASQKIDRMANEYIVRFDQESVLASSSEARARFIARQSQTVSPTDTRIKQLSR